MNMRRGWMVLAVMSLAGCATTGDVDDVGPVGSAAGRLEPTYIRTADGEVAAEGPLDAARVVQIALARHPEVLAELARLDAVEAERVQAGLLRNPMLELMLLRPEGGGRFAIEAGWYTIVALTFSSARPRGFYLRAKRFIDRMAGAVIGLLGVKLIYDALGSR